MHFIYDTVMTWEKTYMDECINILQKLCDDHIQEKSDFQTLVNQNLFQIEKINSYLKSLFEKEDPEFKVFSPRNVESIYEEQIASNQEKKKKLETENLSYYKKINQLSEQIEQLSFVIDSLKRNEQTNIGNQFDISNKRIDNVIQSNNYNQINNNVQIENTIQSSNNNQENNNNQIVSNNISSLSQNHISHRILNCVSFIDSDPERAKVELKAIAKKMI